MGESNYIEIIGPGAVGTMLGAYLSSYSCRVGYRGRKGRLSYSALVDLGEGERGFNFPKVDGSPNLIFICVKAYQLSEVLKSWGAISQGARGVIISNGLVDSVVKNFSLETQLSLGTCNIGCSKVGESSWRVFNNGSYLIWGDENREPSDVESDIEGSLDMYGFRYDRDASLVRKEKWLFNTVINSMAAYYSFASNGLLLDKRDELRQVFDEAYELGLDLFKSWRKDRESLWMETIQLIEATAGNENSMVRDLRLGRLTENEFLAGLVSRSQQYFPRLRNLDNFLSNNS